MVMRNTLINLGIPDNVERPSSILNLILIQNFFSSKNMTIPEVTWTSTRINFKPRSYKLVGPNLKICFGVLRLDLLFNTFSKYSFHVTIVSVLLFVKAPCIVFTIVTLVVFSFLETLIHLPSEFLSYFLPCVHYAASYVCSLFFIAVNYN